MIKSELNTGAKRILVILGFKKGKTITEPIWLPILMEDKNIRKLSKISLLSYFSPYNSEILHNEISTLVM